MQLLRTRQFWPGAGSQRAACSAPAGRVLPSIAQLVRDFSCDDLADGI